VKRFESRNEFSARRVSAVFLFHGTYFTKVAHARARACFPVHPIYRIVSCANESRFVNVHFERCQKDGY